MKRLYTLLFLLSAFYVAVSAQEMTVAERNAAQGFNDTIDRLDPDFVWVSLCIADPTDQSQDYLGITGHAFLRLQCTTFGLDYCYSYESEKIKGQLCDYLTGKLRMGMFVLPTDTYVEDYRVWKRAVHEYRINLPPEAELRLWEQMDNHMMTERDMEMNLFRFGCTNTILRYVEKALSPIQIDYNWPDKYVTMSAMEIYEDHLKDYPWNMLGIRLIEGRRIREKQTLKQKINFPTDLVEVWSQSTINGEPVLDYVGDIVSAVPVVVSKPWFTPQVFGIFLFVLMVGFIVWRVYRKRNTP